MPLPVAAAALCLALGVDWLFGEPPARLHPVVAMGHFLCALGPRLARLAPATAFAGGAIAWCAGAAATAGVALAAQSALQRLPAAGAAIGAGLLLKPLLSWRMLHDEVSAVEDALGRSLDDGRRRLARLVSRDVSRLDASEVREGAIESLAENLNDSVVAPVLWFLVGGLGAAALYRFANTADAMWGYRGRFEWAGKWAARADDALSWVPARVTAALLCLAAGHRPRWAAARRAARATPSPNGGWPMGVMALLLDVRLSKPGAYVLHPEGPPPGAAHVARALRWIRRAVAGVAAVAGLLAAAAPLLARVTATSAP